MSKGGLSDRELLECERRVECALARAAARLHEAVEVRTPADELMLAEEAEGFGRAAGLDEEERMAVLVEFFRCFFDYLFEDGPHPGWVLRRVYALARRYRPDLILGMNGTDLGMMFGEGRAAQSWRMQRIFERLKAGGVRGFLGSGFKSESARERYAEAQRGNRNRCGRGKAKGKGKSPAGGVPSVRMG